jgi:hypothetical protein
MKLVYSYKDCSGHVILTTNPEHSQDNKLASERVAFFSYNGKKAFSDPISIEETDLTDPVAVINWLVE